MGELFYAAIAPANLLLSGCLVVVVLYWLSVILGALHVDSFNIEIDKDLDIQTDVHHDVEIGKDISAPDGGGLFIGILRFFNFGQVPFMLVMSILILSMWSISLYCNNPHSPINPSQSFLWAIVWGIPNLVASLFITKLATAPLVPIFKKLNGAAPIQDFSGKIGTLTTPTEGDNLGQAKIMIDSSILTINIRSLDGKKIEKGDKVVIVEEIKGQKCFIVQKMEQP